MILNKEDKIFIIRNYIENYNKVEIENLKKRISKYNYSILFNFLNLSINKERKEAWYDYLNLINKYPKVFSSSEEGLKRNHVITEIPLYPSILRLPTNFFIDEEGNTIYTGASSSDSCNIFFKDKNYKPLISINLFNKTIKTPHLLDPFRYGATALSEFSETNSNRIDKYDRYESDGPSLFKKGIKPTFSELFTEGDMIIIKNINDLIGKRDEDIFNIASDMIVHFLSFRDSVLKARTYASICERAPFLTPYVEKYVKEIFS